jgi:hypothetical protein
MIEAVENHMPEVIIIDEIGRELETQAARTIAERGVQLVATAHGNSLDNLINNPTLADLIGGIQSVTLGDEEARRRGTQKSILERKAPPTFECVVEIQAWNRVTVHPDVASTVDAMLRGHVLPPEERSLDESGRLRIERQAPSFTAGAPRSASRPGMPAPRQPQPDEPTSGAFRVYLFGVNRGRAEEVLENAHLPIEITDNLRLAQAVLTTKAHYRNRPATLMQAENSAIPVIVLRKNTGVQIEQSLASLARSAGLKAPAREGIEEAEDAIERLRTGMEDSVDLSPQSAYVRRLQHEIAARNRLESRSSGREPMRRVRLFRT